MQVGYSPEDSFLAPPSDKETPDDSNIKMGCKAVFPLSTLTTLPRNVAWLVENRGDVTDGKLVLG